VIILGEELPQIDVRAAGEIAAMDLASSAFALHTRQGEDLTFTTTDQTRFRIRGSEGGALGDLEVGMRAGVVAEGEDDGTLVALVVVAVDPQDRPEVVRFAGEITGVVPGQGTLSLHTRGGEDVTFQTNERTRFRSRDGSIESIHDLRQGMVALVGPCSLSSWPPAIAMTSPEAAGSMYEPPAGSHPLGTTPSRSRICPGKP
jgi:hypothetical protein